MRGATISAGLVVLGLAAVAAYALEGKKGYTATEVFKWGDVRGGVEYDSSFSGEPWHELPFSFLGKTNGLAPGGLAVDAGGDLFFRVTGGQGVVEYHGVIHHDGTKFVNLIQTAWDNSNPPSTAGPPTTWRAVFPTFGTMARVSIGSKMSRTRSDDSSRAAAGPAS